MTPIFSVFTTLVDENNVCLMGGLITRIPSPVETELEQLKVTLKLQ